MEELGQKSRLIINTHGGPLFLLFLLFLLLSMLMYDLTRWYVLNGVGIKALMGNKVPGAGEGPRSAWPLLLLQYYQGTG